MPATLPTNLPMTLTVRDETIAGESAGELTLDLLTETLTVRELIRSRVYQEVDDHNRRVRAADAGAVPYGGLVTPADGERELNGPRAGKVWAREVDWRAQFNAACLAFERNRFFVLIDDRQAESLEEEFTARPGMAVSFVKLVPLVGG